MRIPNRPYPEPGPLKTVLFEPDRIVPVLVPVAVEGPWSYRVPDGMDVRPGTVVEVPVGPRKLIGAVWDGEPDTEIDPKRLRNIHRAFDVPPISDDMRRFVDWVANWTLAAPGMVLRMVLRVRDALEPEAPVRGVARAGDPPGRMTPARQKVLAALERVPLGWTKSALAEEAGVSAGVIDGLVEAGTLALVDLPRPPRAPLDVDRPGPSFTPAQAEAAGELRKAAEGGFSVTLIDGVTGSGKTEVYFEAVAEVLRRGHQALVLLPEIALTNQFLDRFEARFGGRPVEWHSELTPRMRARTWRDVASGEARVVVGARSALFLPFRDLGLIVVDEEHDSAFKQDDRVPYSARDMSVVRGNISGFPVLLSSATPSVESRVNAEAGRYRRVVLEERATGAEMPVLTAIDMRNEGPERGKWLAPKLVSAIREALVDKAQSLLFLNRRGYAPLTLCRHCGHRFQCPDCSAWLVEHRFRGRLVCHHCGHQEPKPDVCPACGTADSLVACGPGVERIAEEIGEIFPEARRLILSSDSFSSAETMRRELKLVEDGEVDIVIGTQLVAKGHNFPLMRLVGVVDADLGLANGDPRAAEKTFQLLAQVTGRAGRIGGGGLGFLQTYAPENPVLQALLSGGQDRFYREEIEARRNAGLPPFGRLAAIIVSSPHRSDAEGYARALVRAAPLQSAPVVNVLGPADAPLALVRGRHRQRILVRAPRGFDLQSWLRAWLNAAPRATGSLRVQIDVDPQSFL
ncbi:primosomal protein N' [Breoghania sp.]|uniref:primosomal protein N' n=1 Tax=Breoghania sp. TaxID=2065378 RepID=UPI002AA77ADF|nr:primosomal protein N' [Breoghania sp.]